jgi:hypothetical protein
VLEISSIALASATLPVVFTATLCALATIVILMIAAINMMRRIEANKTTIFINDNFRNQKYLRESVIGFKSYSMAVAGYSAEKTSQQKFQRILSPAFNSTIVAIR